MADRFKRLPGTSRNYLDTQTGKIVSRRQRDNILRAEGKIKTKDIPTKARQRQKQARYQSLIDNYIAKKRDDGVILSKKAARESTEFKSLFRQLNSVAKTKQKATDTLKSRKRLNEKMIKLLTALGRRDDIPGWVPVGFSDRFRKGKLKSPANLPKAFRFKGV